MHYSRLSLRKILAGAAAMLAPTLAVGQSFPSNQSFPADGETITLSFSEQPEDLTIPIVDPPGFVRVVVTGGRGGKAGNGCVAKGGFPAQADVLFAVGDGEDELLPGGTLRFLIGEEGDRALGNWGHQAAGGGGGSGVLYCPDGSCSEGQWELLVVAGGGGGGTQREGSIFCGPGQTGKNASLSEVGTSGDNNPGSAGSPGHGGVGGDGRNGAGGGYYGSGECANSCSHPEVNGELGADFGGIGGVGAWDLSSGYKRGSDGGWGCGGGGAGAGDNDSDSGGGGGGGYSGGGPGKNPSGTTPPGRGGGGGSYVSPRALTSSLRIDDWYHAADGWAELTAVAQQTGESCSTTFVIPDLGLPIDVQGYDGSTEGGEVTVGASCAQGANATPDDWYSFTNTLDCDRLVGVILFDWALSNSYLEVFDSCDGGPIACHEFEATFPSIDPFELVVPAGETRWFRVESAHAGSETSGMDYRFEIAITAVGADSDGDGVPDCVDNCPSSSNGSQNDDDGDGVGDACDLCPGGDDQLDEDLDGVPDGCDLCYGDDLLDMDLDGVPDDCDFCLGDDGVDSDGDGLPDACDPCDDIAHVDCNGNLIGDSCDLQTPARYENFNGAGNERYTINGSENSTAQVYPGGELLLTFGLGAETGTVVFDPVSPLATGTFRAEFHFMNQAVIGAGNHGFSFCVFDANVYDETTVFDESGLGSGAISILFDTRQNGSDPDDNHIELLVDGVSIAMATPSFTIEDGVWRKAEVVFGPNNLLTLVIENLDGSFETIFSSVFLPGFVPFEARYGIGARSGANNTSQTRVDQVLFRDMTGTFLTDTDDDGNLDACQGSQEIVLGTPANPNVLVPGADPGPALGSTYEPYVDHSGFMPGAIADLLMISLAPVDDAPTAYGTLLVDVPANLVLVGSPGEPFEISISNSSVLFGVPVYMQAMSYSVNLPFGFAEFALTNAIYTEIAGLAVLGVAAAPGAGAAPAVPAPVSCSAASSGLVNSRGPASSRA